jgi:hypothetical protein
MKQLLLIALAACAFSCAVQKPQSVNTNATSPAPAVQSGAPAGGNSNSNAETSRPPETVSGPRSIREFFNLLPAKYFTLEGCEPAKDKNCDRARAEYVKTFLEIEDRENGYWKSGCDGGQSCLEMAIFKRPDGNYTVLVMTAAEMTEESWFLEYSGGKWTDIGAKIVPDFSTKNIYVPPRVGTSVEVYKKNFPEPDFSERGEKLYILDWKDGRFVKR